MCAVIKSIFHWPCSALCLTRVNTVTNSAIPSWMWPVERLNIQLQYKYTHLNIYNERMKLTVHNHAQSKHFVGWLPFVRYVATEMPLKFWLVCRIVAYFCDMRNRLYDVTEMTQEVVWRNKIDDIADDWCASLPEGRVKRERPTRCN